ncbi:hypothetical protein [Allosphingosinicella sp.]|jgi:hypothetical protein|uniref:hypothetical protein n=1 Tax=Allosphingosinicella sp. TaxID=2823234 RepID=UPI002EFD18DA
MKNALLLTALTLLLPTSTPAAAAAEPDLAAWRTATERFRDVRVAIAEGYIPEPTNTCETSTNMGAPAELGAMGIHYFRPDLLGITAPPNPRVDGNGTHTDFTRPSILIYEPQADGSLELVAIENLVFERSWHSAGNAERPRIGDKPWERMADDPSTPVDEAHGFEPHYDQHVWLYRDNPSGMFSPYNPNVTCRHQPAPSGSAHGGRP